MDSANYLIARQLIDQIVELYDENITIFSEDSHEDEHK